MRTLLELAAVCEAGSDRELDCLIWAAHNDFTVEWQGPCLVIDGHVIGSIDPSEHNRWFTCNRSDQGPGGIKAYTASLDAAMSLVPEGTGLTISRYWTAKADGPVWSAEIATGGTPEKPRQVFDCYDAATPALALCAAALRARASSDGGE